MIHFVFAGGGRKIQILEHDIKMRDKESIISVRKTLSKLNNESEVVH